MSDLDDIGKIEIEDEADSGEKAESEQEDLWKDDPKAMSPLGG